MLGFCNTNIQTARLVIDRGLFTYMLLYDTNIEEFNTFISNGDNRKKIVLISEVRNLKKLIVKCQSITTLFNVAVFDTNDKLNNVKNLRIIDSETTKTGYKVVNLNHHLINGIFSQDQPVKLQDLTIEEEPLHDSILGTMLYEVVKSIKTPTVARSFKDVVFAYIAGMIDKKSYESSQNTAIQQGANEEDVAALHERVKGAAGIAIFQTICDITVYGTELKQAMKDSRVIGEEFDLVYERFGGKFDKDKFIKAIPNKLRKLREPEKFEEERQLKEEKKKAKKQSTKTKETPPVAETPKQEKMQDAAAPTIPGLPTTNKLPEDPITKENTIKDAVVPPPPQVVDSNPKVIKVPTQPPEKSVDEDQDQPINDKVLDAAEQHEEIVDVTGNLCDDCKWFKACLKNYGIAAGDTPEKHKCKEFKAFKKNVIKTCKDCHYFKACTKEYKITADTKICKEFKDK